MWSVIDDQPSQQPMPPRRARVSLREHARRGPDAARAHRWIRSTVNSWVQVMYGIRQECSHHGAPSDGYEGRLSVLGGRSQCERFWASECSTTDEHTLKSFSNI